jgi:hypothetical protein
MMLFQSVMRPAQRGRGILNPQVLGGSPPPFLRLWTRAHLSRGRASIPRQGKPPAGGSELIQQTFKIVPFVFFAVLLTHPAAEFFQQIPGPAMRPAIAKF